MYSKENKLKIQRLFDKINFFSIKINNNEVISALEIDLLKSNLISLYDTLIEKEELERNITAPIEKKAPSVIIETKEEEVQFNIGEEEMEENIISDEIQEVPIEVKEEKIASIPVIKENTIENSKPQKEAASLNDLFTISDSKIEAAPKSSNQLSNESIRDYISINDKLLFINELFESNKDVYNAILDKLDTISSPDDAVDYINEEAASKYNWIDKEQEAELFFSIIKKKIRY